jgi:RNA polymerase sigma-70 factor (ECF subfamily)
METHRARISVRPLRREESGVAEELLNRGRAGEVAAFREIVAASQARVFSLAHRLTGVRADAEEVAQDVFVQLHGALPLISDSVHLRKWLVRAVYHRSIDRFRQRERQGQKLPLEALGDFPEGQVPETDTDPLAASHVYALLLKLQPDARAVVVLRYQDDLDPVDIADELGMPINTVKSHLRRSLQWLREQCSGEIHGS